MPEKPAKSLEAFASTAFGKRIRKLGIEEESGEIDETIRKVVASFGNPHLHAGLGIRVLSQKSGIYECRYRGAGQGGLKLRMIFILDDTTTPKSLIFDYIGNHDEVRNYLKR
ncbi:MAG: hypothetical protein QM680_12545 [Luteolibacter sp.]